MLDTPEKELGRTAEAGTSSGEGDLFGFLEKRRIMLVGKGGGGRSRAVASFFRLPLGVAMTCTPCPNGFRTGFFCFRALPPPPPDVDTLLFTSSAISLATSSRLGLRKV